MFIGLNFTLTPYLYFLLLFYFILFNENQNTRVFVSSS